MKRSPTSQADDRGADHTCAEGAFHVERPTDEVRRFSPRNLALAPIRGYRRWISPGTQNRCRYYPSCSSYAEQAVAELGVVRGGALAIWRVLRCNPFSHGGYDPVSARGRRPRPERTPATNRN